MFSSKELWHGVSESSNKVHVLQQQMERLKDALEQATAMVSKWGNPMILRQAVRFLKSNMDKEDILDVSKPVAMHSAQPAAAALVPKCCDHACSSLLGIHWYACDM